MTGGGFFGVRPGEWTDDTSMALALADSLIECRGFDPTDQMRKYCRWWFEHRYTSREAAFGVGAVVRQALERFEFTPGPKDPFQGAADPLKAGNGSIMRLAPVPLAFRRLPAAALGYCVESSRTTHSAPQCLDACWYFGGLILGAAGGVAKAELLSPG